MKYFSIMISVLFFFALAFSGSAQFEWEHTYPGYYLNRLDLEGQGERYINFDPSAQKVMVYDGDHQLLTALITPQALAGHIVPSLGFDLSSHLFDTDDGLECQGFYTNENGYYLGAIWDEDGSLLLSDSITNDGRNIYNSVVYISQNPIVAKLVRTSYNQLTDEQGYSILSLPGMAEEHHFSSVVDGAFSAQFIMPENEEPILIQTLNDSGEIRIFNLNYDVIHTIPLPDMGSASYVQSYNWSRTDFNNDNFFELIVYYTENGNNVYLVINENGEVLFDSDNYISLSKDEGMDPKLLKINHTDHTTEVYTLPAFTIEHSYANQTYWGRQNLGINGEKYFLLSGDTLNIYNADHSSFNEIALYKNSTGDVPSVIQISDDIANADSKLEYIISWWDNETADREVFVVQDDGTLLHSEPDGISCMLHRLGDLEDKLICYNYDDGTDEVKVYAIHDSINGIRELQTPDTRLQVYPNPFSDNLRVLLSPTSAKADLINLYDTQGHLIKQWTPQKSPATLQHLSQIPVGSYIVEVMSEGKRLSKIVIKH